MPVVQSGTTKKTTIADIAAEVDISGKLDTTSYIKGAYCHCAGKPGASEVIGGTLMPYAGTFTTSSCVGKALVAATASTTVTIKLNGSSIGTAVWASSGTTATMTITSSPQSYSAGDHVTFHAPSSADATLADIDITLR